MNLLNIKTVSKENIEKSLIELFSLGSELNDTQLWLRNHVIDRVMNAFNAPRERADTKHYLVNLESLDQALTTNKMTYWSSSPAYSACKHDVMAHILNESPNV